MSAGIIALTNNSAAVTGTGTAFTTDLKANDFIVVIVGGVTYTLGIKSVESATALTLITAYDGPTATGNAWTAVPNATLVGITAQVAADVGKAIRGLNLDKDNWQQVFSGTGTITVTRPDGSTYTGPAWSSITTSLAGKADTTSLAGKADTTSLAGKADLVSGAVAIGQGGTGGKTKEAAWIALATYGTAAGTAAQGNDGRLNTIDGKSGGTLSVGASFATISVDQSGATNGQTVISAPHYSFLNGRGAYGDPRGAYTALYAYETVGTTAGANILLNGYNVSPNWQFCIDNNAYGAGAWIAGSDEAFKGNIRSVENALPAVLSCRHSIYDKQDGGAEVGVIAQDIEKWCKEAIVDGGPKTFSNGRTLQNMKGVNTAGWAAAFHGSAITTLFELLDLALTDPEAAKERINEIKGMVVIPTPMADSEKVFGALTWDEMPADTDFTNSD